ncbi:permease IIC component [Tetragenococcus halophilus subsp. flandriensis]|uniref:PTS sugar transporter subunit IIC n=1 Tax=Tetragenococcus halophilus TaxID=51669 RepID=UPI0023E9C62F|nr:PTS transporter subunit EIIC [Tetragenococcus halophilus]GMA08806.1 permease IIC component [Tetragenococcus halophilus subsp. flandriensis]
MGENNNNTSFVDRFAEIAGKIGSITYLQVLKNSFQSIMPLFILAGFGVLINSVVFPLFADGSTLTNLQTIGALINNATLNISGILVVSMIAYNLSEFRGFGNSISSVLVALASFFAVMPITVDAPAVGSEDTLSVTDAVTYDIIGTNGIFAGIIIGFLATEIFIKFSRIDKLQISLGESVPSSVSKNFTVLIPVIITVGIFAIVASVLSVVWGTDLLDIIETAIQEPLKNFGTGLWGFILIYSIGVLLFTLGIHHSVVTDSVLKPVMLINMGENIEAASAGEEVPNIINESFQIVFGQIGGHGGTLALILVILIFSRYAPYKKVTQLAAGPGLFNINEPVIFGIPIVFNIVLMIPFILSPIVGILIGYFATWIGFITPFSVLVPWTLPPLLNGYLASAGDWRVIIVQLIVILAQCLLYLPFLKVAERSARYQTELDETT